MPELPEVETTKNGIAPHIVQRRFNSIIIRQPQLRWLIPKELPRLLAQQQIIQVVRRAKYILIYTSQTPGCLLIHLGMSGSLRILSANHLKSVKKHDHVDFILDNAKIMRYTDPRRFGAILWVDLADPYSHKLLAHLGPEPLSRQFSARSLFTITQRKHSDIKQVIMDSKVVVGVGNIYANEALFLAGIRPDRPANSLSMTELQRLVQEIKQILRKAIKQGGTTLRDFTGSDGQPGYFKQQLFVYGRKNQACRRCGNTLIELRQHGRSSVYCSECQC